MKYASDHPFNGLNSLNIYKTWLKKIKTKMKSFIRITSPKKVIREYNESFLEKKFEFEK